MLRRCLLPLLLCLLLLSVRPVSALSFVFTDGSAMAALKLSSPGLYDHLYRGLEGAAAELSDVFLDPITLKVTVEMGPPGAGYLAAAGPSSGFVSYAEFQARLPHLPRDPVWRTDTTFQTVDAGRVALTTAHMLAAETVDTDLRYEQSAGVLLFSRENTLDMDRSDGMTSFDGIAVIEHELLHLMGFMSAGDILSPGVYGTVVPGALDLLRYSAEDVLDLSPTPTPKYLSVDNGRTSLGTVASGYGAGEPQAHHYNMPIQPGVPVMNHAFVAGLAVPLTPPDYLPLGRTGWDINPRYTNANVGAPEPSPAALLLFLLLTLWAARRRNSDG